MAPEPGLRLPSSLDQVRIQTLPATAYYIADFITEDEEELILQKIEAAPKPRWKQLSHRRLQTWPSDLLRDKLLEAPLPSWLVDPIIARLVAIPQSPLPPDEATTAGQGHQRGIFSTSPHQRPNHVLINEYPPGVGIMPHKPLADLLKDGSAYHPVVCTVSLGASLCLNIYNSKDDGTLNTEPVAQILQEPRSLLITTDDLYTEYLHGIADIEEDINLSADTVANWDLLRARDAFASGRSVRGTRVSLTYRDVIKVSKLGSKIGVFGKRP